MRGRGSKGRGYTRITVLRIRLKMLDV